MLKITDKEIEKRIDEIKTTDDMGKLYFDMFGEHPNVTSGTWGAYPVDTIWNAIVERKPIKPDPLFKDEGDIITF